MTIDEILEEGAEKIATSHDVALWRRYTARADAEELLGYVIGLQIRSRHLDDEVTNKAKREFDKLLVRRIAGEPVPLIIGYVEFDKMRIGVRKGVFVPRNSSELMSKETVARIRSRKSAISVDVASGAGPVALSIAKRAPKAQVIGVDISGKAVKVATENARNLRIRNVRFIKSDLINDLPQEVRGRVDVFTMHPPYVRRRELTDLPTEIIAFEPNHTLNDGSNDGMGLVRRLAQEGPDWLRPGGWIMTEVSPDRSLEVRRIMRAAGAGYVKSLRDKVGATRVIAAQF